MSCSGEERAALASALQELLNPAVVALIPSISICIDPKSHRMNLPLKRSFLMYFACFSIINGLMN